MNLESQRRPNTNAQTGERAYFLATVESVLRRRFPRLVLHFDTADYGRRLIVNYHHGARGDYAPLYGAMAHMALATDYDLERVLEELGSQILRNAYPYGWYVAH